MTGDLSQAVTDSNVLKKSAGNSSFNSLRTDRIFILQHRVHTTEMRINAKKLY
mgnify:CR=1 FL=1